MTDEKLLIRVPEAARRMGIGKSMAWEMARRGELPGVVRMGRSVRVSVKRLQEWIDERTADPAA